MTTVNAMTLSSSSAYNAELALLRQELNVARQQLDELQNDIRFIKGIFLAKQAKKEKRRERKEQERFAIEKEKRAQKLRATYEQIIWKLIRWPWELWPAPSSKLSPKEFELVSLLSRNKSDDEIAHHMDIKGNSVRPRICAANKRLGFNMQQELVAYYLGYQKTYRDHRHRRCLALLTWLLNPPPGFIRRRNLVLTWKQTLGRGRVFRYVGPYIPIRVFDDCKHYEHNVLRLKARGLSDVEIAERLKLKPPVLRGYISQIRCDIKRATGITLRSDDQIVSLYKKYLKWMRQREQAK